MGFRVQEFRVQGLGAFGVGFVGFRLEDFNKLVSGLGGLGLWGSWGFRV